MTALDTLVERLEASALSPSDKVVAAALAGDLAGLMAAQASGQDITVELTHIRAQTANISAAASAVVQTEFRLWATRLVAELLMAAL